MGDLSFFYVSVYSFKEAIRTFFLSPQAELDRAGKLRKRKQVGPGGLVLHFSTACGGCTIYVKSVCCSFWAIGLQLYLNGIVLTSKYYFCGDYTF